jgi:hypothetical protein
MAPQFRACQNTFIAPLQEACRSAEISQRGVRQLEWISAAEGMRFAEVMTRMEMLRGMVSEKEIAQTIAILQ